MALFKTLLLLVSCLALFLLVTLSQMADSTAILWGDKEMPPTLRGSIHRGTTFNVTSPIVHNTKQIQTTGVPRRRPPSGPNPEGNFEVNAATKGNGKHGTMVQNVEKSATSAAVLQKNTWMSRQRSMHERSLRATHLERHSKPLAISQITLSRGDCSIDPSDTCFLKDLDLRLDIFIMCIVRQFVHKTLSSCKNINLETLLEVRVSLEVARHSAKSVYQIRCR